MLILFGCQAATDTLPPQSPQATTTTSVPVAEVATPPPFQTSPPDPTNLPFQASDPTPLPPDQHPATGFTPQVTQVSDPAVNYANAGFTADNRYMVWFEMTDNRGNGITWHCSIDPETGDLIPSDGKGFYAFESTIFGRANPGLDADGAYYVSVDRTGNMILVRPTGATSGDIRRLPTPPDPTQRTIYPAILPDRQGGFVFWIKNEAVPRGGTNRANARFELQYVSLGDPTLISIVERQERPLSLSARCDQVSGNDEASSFFIASCSGLINARNRSCARLRATSL